MDVIRVLNDIRFYKYFIKCSLKAEYDAKFQINHSEKVVIDVEKAVAKRGRFNELKSI